MKLVQPVYNNPKSKILNTFGGEDQIFCWGVEAEIHLVINLAITFVSSAKNTLECEKEKHCHKGPSGQGNKPGNDNISNNTKI